MIGMDNIEFYANIINKFVFSIIVHLFSVYILLEGDPKVFSFVILFINSQLIFLLQNDNLTKQKSTIKEIKAYYLKIRKNLNFCSRMVELKLFSTLNIMILQFAW